MLSFFLLPYISCLPWWAVVALPRLTRLELDLGRFPKLNSPRKQKLPETGNRQARKVYFSLKHMFTRMIQCETLSQILTSRKPHMLFPSYNYLALITTCHTPRQNRVMGHGTFPQIFEWKSVYETKANQDMWISKYVSILV